MLKRGSAVAAAASRLRVFSLRELALHRRRTFASVAVMAVSAMYLVAVFGIFGSITGSVNRLADGVAGIAALEVSGITDAGFPDSITADVAAVPGVAVAAPMIRTSAPVASGTSGPVLLFGADASISALGGALKDAVSARPANPSDPANGVRVGPGVGHAKGDTFQLGSASVQVIEVLGGKQLANLNGGHYVLAPLALAQNITDRQGQLDSILITVKPGADLAKVRNAVTAAVNGRAIVADPSMRATRAGDGVKMMNYMALMGAMVALMVGAFLIYTTMTMAITQRRPVISMLRAIGGRRVTIVRDMLAEAALLGLVGGTIGSVIGIFMGRIAIGRLPAAMTQGLEARVEYWLPEYAIPAALVATALTSVVASAMATRQVYKVSPIEALAPVGASAADRVPRWLRSATGIGAVTVLAVSILVVVTQRGILAFAAMSAVFCAEVALGFALTAFIVKATAATARMFGSSGALAAATIERAPRRVWATVMTVLIAVVTTIAITGTNTDMIRSARGIFSSVA
ncbi:MAG: putative transport system permease protein, partial [Mycobacterium sp.]|nr:putative transport system permease protein [Mycobacterium sp.]